MSRRETDVWIEMLYDKFVPKENAGICFTYPGVLVMLKNVRQ